MTNPLRDPAPAEIRLSRPPLHRVLAVIQFPAILKISQEAGIVGFQDKVRKSYPDFQREQELALQLQMGPSGELLPPQSVISNVWRFASTDSTWRITLSTQSVALETQGAYSSREDFLNRLGQVLDIFTNELEPSNSVRIGIRYLNVLNAVDLDSIKGFVRPGLRSLSDTEISENITASAHSVTFDVPEGTLFTRWGVLPPNAVHDPNMLAPTDERRWYLDMDCFSEQPVPFGDGKILEGCRAKTKRIYSFFRWAMTSEFIEKQENA